MAASLGRFAVWDDTKRFPTRPVGSEPAQGSEGEAHEHHVHIHIGDEALLRNGTPRASRRDNMGDPGEELPAVRRNGPNGAQPRILARMLQDGETGRWVATDNEGNALEIRTANDGALEICTRHDPNEESEIGDGDPKGVGIERPPGSAALDRQRRLGARALDALTRTGFCQDPYLASAEYAIRMREAFKPRRRS
jgi:hypothetical protein